ncbi:uncharacterized protein AMSG_04564 [Thecamonas trahens ATCC 50062]|uniref:Uncharacterized protein n=1 Tax=Thecamonas trahens ATCC 50062 TaxID=461836 RepID=A0A0L0D8Z9_THETB|nr:hypothetical protein AMSG_04564 [Thecamonas trahens ATCC 50062]KNC48819.1 hypothetical protein AMSG_04564 [Thecamonas trahens ATCC 50062]|eukprot:XP_013758239.1 hypothetical protein AMSG_04564 [Thecamonas trahens ATCC 50062]
MAFASEQTEGEYKRTCVRVRVQDCNDATVIVHVSGKAPCVIAAATPGTISGREDTPISFSLWRKMMEGAGPGAYPPQSWLNKTTKDRISLDKNGWIVTRVDPVQACRAEDVRNEASEEGETEEWKTVGSENVEVGNAVNSIVGHCRNYVLRFLNAALLRGDGAGTAVLRVGVADDGSVPGVKLAKPTTRLKKICSELDRFLLGVFPPIVPGAIQVRMKTLTDVPGSVVVELLVHYSPATRAFSVPYFSASVGATLFDGSECSTLPPMALWWRHRPMAFESRIQSVLNSTVNMRIGSEPNDDDDGVYNPLAGFDIEFAIEPGFHVCDDPSGALADVLDWVEEGMAVTAIVVVDEESSTDVLFDDLAALCALLGTLGGVRVVVLARNEASAKHAHVVSATSPLPCIGTALLADLSHPGTSEQPHYFYEEAPTGVVVVNSVGHQSNVSSDDRVDAIRTAAEAGTIPWEACLSHIDDRTVKARSMARTAVICRDVVASIVSAVTSSREVVVYGDVRGAGATTAAMLAALELTTCSNTVVLYATNSANMCELDAFVARLVKEKDVIVFADGTKLSESIVNRCTTVDVVGPLHVRHDVCSVMVSSRLSKTEYKTLCNLLLLGYPQHEEAISTRRGEWRAKSATAEMCLFFLAAVYGEVASVSHLVNGTLKDDSQSLDPLAVMAFIELFSVSDFEAATPFIVVQNSHRYVALRSKQGEILAHNQNTRPEDHRPVPPMPLIIHERTTMRLLRRSQHGFVFIHPTVARLVLKKFGMPLVLDNNNNRSKLVLRDVDTVLSNAGNLLSLLGATQERNLLISISGNILRGCKDNTGLAVCELCAALERGGEVDKEIVRFVRELGKVFDPFGSDLLTVVHHVLVSKAYRRAAQKYRRRNAVEGESSCSLYKQWLSKAADHAAHAFSVCEASEDSIVVAKCVMCQNALCWALFLLGDRPRAVDALGCLMRLDPQMGQSTLDIADKINNM